MSPGWIAGPIANGLAQRIARRPALAARGEAVQVIMKSLGRMPLGRPAAPKEVADPIAFPASDRAASITGSAHVIDGGPIPTP